MKPLQKLHFRAMLVVIFLSFLTDSCFLKQDRTTVVYGKITDEKGQAVDSILVSINGVKGFLYEPLKEVYSGSDGGYELVVDVPRRYGSANVIVPFGSYDNPKYDKNYKGKRTLKNDQLTKNCCTTQIGEKTKYDFQLISK